MAFPPKQILPCLCSILLLLSTTFFSHATAQPCRSRDSDQIHTSERVGSEFYAIDKESGVERNLSYSDVNNTRVLSTIVPDGLGFVYASSFNATISYQPLWNPSTSSRGGLAFLIFHATLNSSLLMKRLSARDVGPLDLINPTSLSADVSGSKVSIRIGVLSSNLTITEYIAADITIVPALGAVANDCTVWIDYDHAERSLSAYVDVQGNPKPDSPIAEVPLKHTDVAPIAGFGLLSTAEQVRHSGVRWNVAFKDTLSPWPLGYDSRIWTSPVTFIALSVLGSVAATAVMATSLACYFNSRYRRWHKDLDQLAESMERLPGVPTKVEFADIKKATSNFHEAMKLGGGGFGTVYKCTLPAAASKTERPMDVAVKKFTRDVQNRCYDDFLAEVSIINRLRHKNIVSLVGWSYNKGEPLLVFEFMTNGSLDQHLFAGGGQQRERGTNAAIQQWATRYEIVRDVATGLHYVHHEYEPMVLHCDIKASNVMLDSSFRARLGDFGLACTVAVDRNSATVYGGTRGYIAPEYGMFGRATRQTDIYALGVLILEVVTGQQVLIHRAADDDDVHITDRVWRLHREGRLLECVDSVLIASSSPDEDSLHAGGDAERLLLLGLACSSPNPSDRPTMPEVVQVIAKSAPPPEVPLMKPRFVWPPPEWAAWDVDDSVGMSMTSNLEGSMASTAERQSQWLTAAAQRRAAGGIASFQLEPSVYVTVPSALVSCESPSRA